MIVKKQLVHEPLLKMKIKNISSSQIDIPEFQLSLKPGDTADISSFDPAVIRAHKLLAIMFQKGLLINLGRLSPSGSSGALNSARDRIAKMNILGDKNDYVLKPASNKKLSTRNSIEHALKDSNRRAPLASHNIDAEERYNDDYYNNMYPGELEPQEHYDGPQIKIDQNFRAAEIAWDGSVTFGQNGQIQTDIVLGKTTFITPDPDELIVKDKGGHEYKVSIERIKEKMLRRCIATNAQGKPCKKYAIYGFQSCLTHMSAIEKQEYESTKKLLPKEI